MSQEKDVVECPFSGHGEALENVKFFRGFRDDVITRDEIAGQFRSAGVQMTQKTAIVSSTAPVSDHPVMDVRELAEAL